jgi:negative regulator of sigma-B (phosphoserine phosphatase)
VQYGLVNRSKPGNKVSGDAYLFHEDQGSTLVALIDGLGAGHAAHEAAACARACIMQNADATLTEMLRRCHQALRSTRGAVIMLMRVIDAEQTVSFAGIGNIGVKVFSDTPIKPLSRNGIVGYRMHNIREYSYPYARGDVFILHSDGISTRFTVDEDWVRDPSTDLQRIAGEIADHFGKDDDATVIVIR